MEGWAPTDSDSLCVVEMQSRRRYGEIIARSQGALHSCLYFSVHLKYFILFKKELGGHRAESWTWGSTSDPQFLLRQAIIPLGHSRCSTKGSGVGLPWEKRVGWDQGGKVFGPQLA